MAQLPGDASNPIDIPQADRPTVSYTGGQAQAAAITAGQATAGLGDEMVKAGGQIQDTQNKLARASAEQAFLSKKLDIDQQFANDPDFTTAPQRYRAALQGALTQTSQGIMGASQRADFSNNMARWIEYGTNSQLRESSRKAIDAGRGSTVDALNDGVSDALRAPDEPTRAAIFSTVHDRIDAAQNAGWFTATEAAKYRKSVPESYAAGRAKMITDTDPAAAVKALQPNGIGADGTPIFDKTGDWRDYLDPVKRMDMTRAAQQHADEQSRAADIDQVRQDRMQTKSRQDAAEKSGNAVVSQLIKDPTQVDPNTIANDPNLDFTQKWHLHEMQKAALATVGDGKDTKTYGPGFPAAYQAVHAADGDPSKITDPFQLYSRVGPKPPPKFALTGADGMTEAGNLDPWNRPSMQNPDGSYSTTSSMSIGTSKGETLIPTVVNGKRLSNDDAIAHFKQTGENLGTFDTPDHADAYATALHNAQATLYDQHGNRLMGDLTVAGVDKLTTEIQAKRSPEGEAESEMKKAFLNNARGQITGTNEGLHLRDPKGDELYLKFMAQALPAFEAGKKAGKTAAQLLNPDSPDYVGKIIPTFKRPISQWSADLLSDNAPAEAAPQLDLTSQAGIVAAYQKRLIDRDAAGAALTKLGIKYDQAAAPASPAAPIP